jgi:hypothetical protein
MGLKEQIEFANTCKFCDWNRSHNGNCKLEGYAPFDCRTCSSYKEKTSNDA